MPQRMKIFVKCTFFCHRPLPPPCRRLACAATVGATTDTHRPATSQLTSNSSFSSLFSFTEASFTLWTSLTLAAPPLRSVSSATAARLLLLLLVDGARRAAPGALLPPSPPLLLLCCPPLLCCNLQLMVQQSSCFQLTKPCICCWPPHVQCPMWKVLLLVLYASTPSLLNFATSLLLALPN